MGISSRNYETALEGLLGKFGISRSTVSRRVVVASASRLKELQERPLKDFDPFTIFIDGYHIAGSLYHCFGNRCHGAKKSTWPMARSY